MEKETKCISLPHYPQRKKFNTPKNNDSTAAWFQAKHSQVAHYISYQPVAEPKKKS